MTLVLTACGPIAPAVAQRSAGAYFPAVPVDGPSADVRGLPDVDVARDGGGALVYVRRDGGEDHVFLSLLSGGVPQAPVRIDGGLPALIGRPSVTASDGGRVVVVFANAAGVFFVIRPDQTQPFSAPQAIGDPGSADPSVDMSINGVAYATWAQGGNVRAAYLPRRQSAFQVYPDPLDLNVASDAGTGDARRPRVSTSSDGTGVVLWGESDATTTRVVARRLIRGRLSAFPIDGSAATLDGRPGGPADTPDVSFEDDSSFAWVVFRQAFSDGSGGTVTRAVARRLRGSGFDDPVGVDGNPPFGAVGNPRVGINGRGQGMIAVEVPGGVTVASVIRDDGITPPRPLGIAGGVVAQPVVSTAENFDGVAAWLQAPAPGAPAQAHAVTLEDDVALNQPPPFGADTVVSDGALGQVDPAAGLDADVDRAGDAAIAFVQGADTDRRLVVAVYDRTPGIPALNTTTNWRRTNQPVLAWSGSFDLWGGINYQVIIDGQPIGAPVPSTSFIPPLPIPDGIHRWQIVATDRRGQVARSDSRNLRVDGTPPKLLVKIGGTRQVGKKLTFAIRAVDLRSPLGSGVRQVRIDYADGTLPTVFLGDRITFGHVFRRGRFKVRISATDNAGNATVALRTVQIKLPKKKSKKGKKK